MNNDLISRSALKEEFAKHEDRKGYLIGDWEDIIDNAPTVEPTFREVVAYECGQKLVERPQGKWTEHYDSSDGFTWLTCSRCMFKAYEDDYNFCPNCGADMRKEANNE